MSESDLTDAEKRYLSDLRKLPTSVPSRLLSWALELIPSIGLFVYGLLAERRLFIVLGFLSLLYFSVWRMYSQLRAIRLIHGIHAKLVPSEQSRDSSPSGSGDQ